MKHSAERPLVVIVEDYAPTRDALAALLDLEGYSVWSCSTGAALLTRLRFGPRPAVVVLDLTLPDTTGGRCLTAIRSSTWADVPVLIFSAWDNLERFGLDAQGLLSKSSEPVTIARTVDRLARLHATPDESRSGQLRGGRSETVVPFSSEDETSTPPRKTSR
jgi:CheY-like chemotaxis protein